MWCCRRRNDENMNSLSVPEWAVGKPAWPRLEDQIAWYDSKSTHCQWWYKRLKFIQIALAVGIPVASHLEPSVAKWVTSISGASIAVLEGVQHMNQYSTLWVMYRSTAERLKHEKFLSPSGAGPYTGLPDADKLVMLAERVEEHVSSEHANWFNEINRTVREKKQGD